MAPRQVSRRRSLQVAYSQLKKPRLNVSLNLYPTDVVAADEPSVLFRSALVKQHTCQLEMCTGLGMATHPSKPAGIPAGMGKISRRHGSESWTRGFTELATGISSKQIMPSAHLT